MTARAARAHLDVCFFHPFGDCNARAAFLALLFVLAREGVALDDVSLLRRVSFQAGAPEDPPGAHRPEGSKGSRQASDEPLGGA
ncbi:hypothetical protein ACBJ59_29840 [Nonomuraea sp. MTCD27]|uniref:hypothetical protein n=1 Tax=Nonomuraea sp. MTCD27 TaxID=1676747 RepID=UPI0035BF0C95